MAYAFEVGLGRPRYGSVCGRRPRCVILAFSILTIWLTAAPVVHAECPGTVTAAESPVGPQPQLANGDSCTVDEGGTINNIGGIGIDAPANNNTITNSGSINTIGAGAIGIRVNNNNTITNRGGIDTTGAGAFGLQANNGNTIFNGGNINTIGAGAIGIQVNNNNTITNRGGIDTTGAGAFGIQANNDNTIVNSGRISAIGADSFAIDFGGGTNQLVLLPGSLLIGRISLGDNFDTVTFHNRVSSVLTFVDDGNGVPEAINTNGLPFAVNGTTVAVLDPSAFNQHDEMLSDLTSGIFNSVHARLAGFSGPVAPQRIDEDFAAPAARPQTAIWAHAFGGRRDQDDMGRTNGADHGLVGGIAGLDTAILPSLRVGLFGGGARQVMDVSFHSQKVDAESYFGGLYASYRTGVWFADVILSGGQSDHDSKRNVFYNLAPGGVQLATATYSGTFISPEVAVGAMFPSGSVGIQVEPSARLRYAHLSLDGYAETGAVDGLSVRGRDVSLWQGRLQIALPMTGKLAVGGTVRFAPRIGVEGRTSDSDNVSAVLIGQAISFNPGGKNDELTGFLGATASFDTSMGLGLLLDGEIHGSDDGFARAEGRAGVKIAF